MWFRKRSDQGAFAYVDMEERVWFRKRSGQCFICICRYERKGVVSKEEWSGSICLEI